MKQKTSTIAPLHDLLATHIAVGRSFAPGDRMLCDQFANIHGLSSQGVWCYALRAGLAQLSGGKYANVFKPMLLEHLKSGGSQVDFAKTHRLDKTDVCRMSRELGWSVQLISADEWAMIQDRRAGK